MRAFVYVFIGIFLSLMSFRLVLLSKWIKEMLKVNLLSMWGTKLLTSSRDGILIFISSFDSKSYFSRFIRRYDIWFLETFDEVWIELKKFLMLKSSRLLYELTGENPP